MARNGIWVVVAGFCVIVPSMVLAQSGTGGSTGGSTTRTDQSGGVLTVQGPQMITGAEMRSQVQPGQLIGGAGEGAGALRGQAEAATQTGRGATRATGGQGGRGGLNNLMNAMNNFGMYNSRFNRRQQIRVPIRLGFTQTDLLPPSPEVALRVQNRLAKIPQFQDNGPLTVELDGRVAVLRGEVVSQHERELVARLVLLEPGISDVRNELQIASAANLP